MEQSAASFDCTLSLHIAMCSYRYVHVNDIAKFIQNLQSMQIVINLGGRGRGGGFINTGLESTGLLHAPQGQPRRVCPSSTAHGQIVCQCAGRGHVDM